jgi:iron complex outermembrane recepter protein
MSLKLIVRRKTCLAIALVLTALPHIVAADVSDASADSQSLSQLTEITVTATRRSESIDRVPISIAALSQNDMTVAGIKDIADVAEATPGLQFVTPVIPSTITTLSIRGLDSYTGPYMTGIYLDDTPLQGRLSSYGNVGSPMPLLFDLNRVEVDRGPQGTLFGSGSEAGTVRFITNDPSLTDFSGAMHGEYSYTEHGAPSYEIGAAAGGPIEQDTLGFRIAAWGRKDGGYVNLVDPLTQDVVDPNVNRDYKQAFRASLAFKVDDVRITPAIYYQEVRQGDSGWFNVAYSDPSQGKFNNEPFIPEASTDKWSLSSVKVEAYLPFADLTSTTSYMHRVVGLAVDFGSVFFPGPQTLPNGSPVPPGPTQGYGSSLAYDVPTSPADAVPSPSGQWDKVFTEEVRLASNQSNAFFTWVGGVFYQHHYQEDWQSSTQLFSGYVQDPATGLNVSPKPLNPPGTSVFYVDQKYTDQQIAAYGQGDFHFTSKLIATLGVRVARETSDFWVVAPTNTTAPLSADLTATPTTPRAALSYQVDPNTLLYLSASKGYRMGGGNGALKSTCPATAPTTYDSDYLWSYELGAKSKFFDNRMEIDASVFHVNWYHIQQLLNVSSCGLSYTANTGDAISNGFDLAMRAEVTRNLMLKLSVGYTDAYFTSNYYLPQTTVLAVQEGDKIGSLPEVAAPWNVNVSPEYKIPLSDGDVIHLSAQYLYASRNPGPFLSLIPGSPSYLPLEAQNPATNLVNARAGYTIGKMDLSLFANNVFNSHPILNRVSDGTVASVYQLYASTFVPLTIGLAINYEF